MQLTSYSDYSLRVLIYLGTRRGTVATIADISRSYRISRNHIVKVVHHLSNLGFVRTIRGRHGGMLLAREPETINVADVIQKTEPNFCLVECFGEDGKCCIREYCRLKGILEQACQGFFAVLGKYTLADLLENKDQLMLLLSDVEAPLRTLILS
jgi:Rrf2 family transcriptional regulator, nitric oxide-sensitive transcriptional repressor